jgi:hypothetical protein
MAEAWAALLRSGVLPDLPAPWVWSTGDPDRLVSLSVSEPNGDVHVFSLRNTNGGDVRGTSAGEFGAVIDRAADAWEMMRARATVIAGGQ